MIISEWRQTWAERSGTDPDFPVGVVQVALFSRRFNPCCCGCDNAMMGLIGYFTSICGHWCGVGSEHEFGVIV